MPVTVLMISPTLLLAMLLLVSLTAVTWLFNCLPAQRLRHFEVTRRHSPLDGIRGVLALSVFTHHFYKNYFFQTTGRWQSPSNEFFTNLGAVPVSIFFLITGYLFFNKIRQPTIDWYDLYRSRVQRILPLYWWLGGCVVVIYLMQQHDALPISAWWHWLGRWLSFNNQALDHFYAWPLVAGAAWTLLYEWGFYFCLPILHRLLHPTQRLTLGNLGVMLVNMLLLYYVVSHTVPRLYWLFFLAGFALWFAAGCKQLLRRFPILIGVLLVMLCGYIMFFTHAYSGLQMVLCAVLFCFVANGFDFFGLLHQQGLKVLGELSYSLYLTHGVVMYVCFNLLNLSDFSQPMSHYVLTYPLVFLLVVAFAYACYRTIEKPFMYRPHRNRS